MNLHCFLLLLSFQITLRTIFQSARKKHGLSKGGGDVCLSAGSVSDKVLREAPKVLGAESNNMCSVLGCAPQTCVLQ